MRFEAFALGRKEQPRLAGMRGEPLVVISGHINVLRDKQVPCVLIKVVDEIGLRIDAAPFQLFHPLRQRVDLLAQAVGRILSFS